MTVRLARQVGFLAEADSLPALRQSFDAGQGDQAGPGGNPEGVIRMLLI